MDCLKCGAGHELSEVSLEGIEVDLCPDCGGLWLDDYELEDILELDADALQPVLQAQVRDDLDEQPATCPRDQSALQRRRQRGVVLDCCAECQGVWLDGGELRRLRGS